MITKCYVQGSDLPGTDLDWISEGADHVGFLGVWNAELLQATQHLLCHGCSVLSLEQTGRRWQPETSSRKHSSHKETHDDNKRAK